MVRDYILKEEDMEIIKNLIDPGPNQIRLLKEYNHNVKSSIRMVPIITSLVSLGILRELTKIRELLEVKEEDKKEKKDKKLNRK